MACIASRQQDLADRNAARTEDEHPALAIERHVDIALDVDPHRIGSRPDEAIHHCHTEAGHGRRRFQGNAQKAVLAEFRHPQKLAVRAQRDAVGQCKALHDRRDGTHVRRHVIDPASRIERRAFEIGEIKSAMPVEYQVIRHVGVGRHRYFFEFRAARFNHTQHAALAVSRSCNENAPVRMDGQATRVQSGLMQ